MSKREEFRQAWIEKKRRSEEEKGKDPVEVVEARVAALPSAFQDRAAKEQDRRTDATDSRYWVAICFQTRAEKEEFLIKAGLADLAMESDYLDGAEVAKRLDVELTGETPKWRDARVNKRLAELAESVPMPAAPPRMAYTTSVVGDRKIECLSDVSRRLGRPMPERVAESLRAYMPLDELEALRLYLCGGS